MRRCLNPLVRISEYLAYGFLYLAGTGVAAAAVALGISMLRERDWIGIIVILIGILVVLNMIALTMVGLGYE
jgi:hypothetical protein